MTSIEVVVKGLTIVCALRCCKGVVPCFPMFKSLSDAKDHFGVAFWMEEFVWIFECGSLMSNADNLERQE